MTYWVNEYIKSVIKLNISCQVICENKKNVNQQKSFQLKIYTQGYFFFKKNVAYEYEF